MKFYNNFFRFINQKRNIIIIEKIKSTPTKYPRKAGMPKKQPII